MVQATLDRLMRDVPDFPKPGIVFKDITPLLEDPAGLREVIDAMVEPWQGRGITRLVGVESRGFLFGAAMAYAMGCGLALVRKPGKLPGETRAVDYELEYGTDRLEMHVDAVRPNDVVLIVDDVLATGGTAEATARLVTDCGAKVGGFSFLLELGFLSGRSRLPEGVDVEVLRTL